MQKNQSKSNSSMVADATEAEIRVGLPHLFAFGWYSWAREFRECREKIALLCAGNQISKSSTQIRTCIDWATNKRLWTELWPVHHENVNLFWYLYPSQKVVDAEFRTKWKQFLPRGKFKDHPTYGWKELKDGAHTIGIEFNSGVLMLFKTYSQKEVDLQTATVYALFCFTAGHLIFTKRGLVPIEKIIVGDIVRTRSGWERVSRVMERDTDTIKRKFSNGEEIEGTPDHPFFTLNRGYVAFSELTESDTLCSLPLWKIKKRLFSLEAFLTRVIHCHPINVILGILKTRVVGVVVDFTMLHFIRVFTGKFQGALQSIILTLIRSITQSKIYKLCPVESILVCIRNLSGRLESISTENVFALFAGKLLKRVRPKRRLLNVAPNRVVKYALLQLAHVFIAAKNLFVEGITPRVHVLGCAPISATRKKVYNITVENSHNYYLSGINCSNCDEELPMRHYYEFMLRISAVDGYFRMVFTATLGQEFWRQVMEPDVEQGEHELLPQAWKKQVSLYDALEYEDGTPGGWTLDRINGVIHNCVSHDEVQRRVWGRFVISLVDRKYPTFDAKRHFIKPFRIPSDWEVYAGVDVGSGNIVGSGSAAHPAAIMFVAVDPKYTQGVFFRGWRGEDIGKTTAGDVLERYLTIKNEIISEGIPEPTRKFYDQACPDFKTISDRIGEGFEPAEKSHEIGDEILNLLFKHDMLKVFSDDPELQKFGWEISSVRKSTPKNKRKDDIVDAGRYSVTKICWAFDKFRDGYKAPEKPVHEETYEEECLRKRRERAVGIEEDPEEMEAKDVAESVDAEFDELNAMYGS